MAKKATIAVKKTTVKSTKKTAPKSNADEAKTVLQYASKKLQADEDFKELYEILTDVKDDGLNLENAPDEFKDNKEVVLAAVEQNGSALEFASNRLQRDKEVVIAAISSLSIYPEKAINYASPELLSDKIFLLEVLTLNGLVLQFLSDNFKADKELVLVAVKQEGSALEFSSKELKDDRDVLIGQRGLSGAAWLFDTTSVGEFAARSLQQATRGGVKRCERGVEMCETVCTWVQGENRCGRGVKRCEQGVRGRGGGREQGT